MAASIAVAGAGGRSSLWLLAPPWLKRCQRAGPRHQFNAGGWAARAAPAGGRRATAPAPQYCAADLHRAALRRTARAVRGKLVVVRNAGGAEQIILLVQSGTAVPSAAAAAVQNAVHFAAGVQYSLSLGACDAHCLAVENNTMLTCGMVFSLLAAKYLEVKFGLAGAAAAATDAQLDRRIAAALASASAQKPGADGFGQQLLEEVKATEELRDQAVEDPVTPDQE